MSTSHKLRGLVAQGLDGQKKAVSAPVYSYPPGSYTFTVPTTGWWRFVLHGPGGTGDSSGGGGGGALLIAERALNKGQTVALVCGTGAVTPTNTTATLPSGEVLTAGAGASNAAGAAGGVATSSFAGDTKLSGGASGSAGAGASGAGDAGGTGGSGSGGSGGGGAAGSGTYRGGDGGAEVGLNVVSTPESPGGGAGQTASVESPGGSGLIVIHRVRLRSN